ncbi:MAG TPA: sugar phosphate nucleotidyltransferase, partial [Chitinophagales bacterium]|nr:sugar phosphate nucleotidyltransferase [Chitinophagales bacterium]
MQTTIRKAVIPAAGFGTRLLPATKAQPKEMLVIVDKPVIQYVVEEAVQSGITDVLIIISDGKEVLRDHFRPDVELEKLLEQKGKGEELREIQKLNHLCNIHIEYQYEQKGLGDAILCAEKFVGNEPFAVLLGDTIIESPVPLTKL